MRLIARCAALLAYLWQIHGSNVSTSEFVQTGGDVQLNVTETDVPQDFDLLTWKFGTSVVVTFFSNVKSNIKSAYTGRVELFENKYSVKLKHLQKEDSGIYTAEVTAAEEKILTEHNVIVQDPVSPVVLTVDSVGSPSSCNLTVTCSTVDRNISRTFRCVYQSCNQEAKDQAEVTNLGASLHVYLLNETIFCNHSNQVSSTASNAAVQEFCAGTRHYVTFVIIGVLVVIAAIAVACYFGKRDQTKKAENTIYATPGRTDNQTQNVSQCPTDDAEDPSPTTTYSFAYERERSSEMKCENSVYALVQR